MATTTTSAPVIVGCRRRPIHTSPNTNCARMYLIPWLSSPVRQLAELARRLLVGLAVNPARLVAHDLAVLELDNTLTHRVHDRGVVRVHDDRGAGPVAPLEDRHDAAPGRQVTIP